MKKILSIVLLLIISLSFVSCNSKETVNNEDSKEVVDNSNLDSKEEIKEDIKYNVNWEKCIKDTEAEFINSEQYSYIKDMYIEVSDEKEKVIFSIVLADSTDKKLAIDVADSVIRRFNANAQIQDSSIKSPGKDYLGGLYDNYSIQIGVTPLSKVQDQSGWYISDVIGRMVHRQPKLEK